MLHEVKVGNTTFIVNSFSRESASETVEQMLKRVIVQNAEKEFKCGYLSGKDKSCNCRKIS